MLAFVYNMFRWLFTYFQYLRDDQSKVNVTKKADRLDRKIGRLQLKAAKMEHIAAKCQLSGTRYSTRKQRKWERKAERCTRRAFALEARKVEEIMGPLDACAETPAEGQMQETNVTMLEPPRYEQVLLQQPPPSYEEATLVPNAPPLYPILM